MLPADLGILPFSFTPTVVTAFGTLAVAILISAVVYVWKTLNLGERRTLPPIAPGSFQDALNCIIGTDGPYRLEENAKQVNFTAFRLNMPPWKQVWVADPELVKEILTDPKSQEKPAIYRQFDSVAGPNIFSATTSSFRWKHARKGAAPAFSSNHVARMNSVCKHFADKMMKERLERAVDQGLSINVAEEMLQVTMSVICEGAFEYPVTQEEGNMIVSSFDLSLREAFQKTPANPLRKWFGFCYPEVRVAQKARLDLQDFALNVIQAYRNKNAKAQKKNPGNKRADTVIRRIVENDNYKNDADRASDIVTFLFAGIDTTSLTTAFAIAELAKHPLEAEWLRDRLQSTPESEWTKLDALQHTIRESMRLHPVAAAGSDRVAGRDFYLNSKDGEKMVIPKGYSVSMPQVLTFWNPNIFESPHEFRPSRWEAPTRQQMDCFRPFSEGRRSCIGQALAQAELTFVVGRLARDYIFEVDQPGEIVNVFTFKPINSTFKVRRATSPS